MILKMEKLILYALSEDKKEILDRLMGLGCVQMISPEQIEDYEALNSLSKRDDPSVYEYETKLSEISSALSVLLEYEPKAGLFTRKNELALHELLDLEGLGEALTRASGIRGIVDNIAEVKSFQSQDLFTRQALEPWADLDVPMDKLSTRWCKVLLFTLPRETDLDMLKSEAASLSCVVELVSSDADLHYVSALAQKGGLDEVQQLFKEKNGLAVTLPALTGTVKKAIADIDKRLESYQTNHDALIESLKEEAKDTSLLKRAYDQLGTAITQQRAKQNLLLTAEAFLVSGWVTEADKQKVESALECYTCYYEFQEPGPDEMPPVRFKNNPLVEPFEAITEMYGLPAPDSVDPNPLIAPFFFIFFGMMLSDAGYGLLLVLAGFIVAHLMPNKEGLGYKMFRLIGLCGISTVVWGAIYGGWFGDVITVFAKTFFGKEIVVPALINPLEEPMTILIMSMVFGVIHIFVGMGVNAYLLIKRGKVLDAIFDIGFWYLVLIGLGLLLVGMVTGGGIVSEIGKWMAILGAVGLLLTGGREKPSIFGKITGGLGSLYNITSYFSDILSYSRILALGLATGVIAMVVNILATMTGSGIIGFLVFVVVFAFGHLLNLAINALGSYVHTSRLQYVEFFGKFYEGGGKPFLPLRPTTKYNLVHSKEDN